MGGGGVDPDQAADIAAYIDSTALPVVPRTPGPTDGPDGAEIFFRPEVGCGTCHSGGQYTDNKSYAMFGETSVNTPPLLGIARTAPYLHDGSAATLADVVERSTTGEMGDTSMLTAAEKAALVDFLRQL